MDRKILIVICLFFSFIAGKVCAQSTLVGEISKADYKNTKTSVVVDSQTKLPIANALVSIPKENKSDYTNSQGVFKLNTSTQGAVILSIQKDGYRPFSLTVSDGKMNELGLLELEKNSLNSTVVSNSLLHLGDDSYSADSAGSCLINAPCVGPVFSQKFSIKKDFKSFTKAYVTIGSVIGLDTIQAMKLGQNQLKYSSSTPLEVFINDKKIGELKINGDNQKLPIPRKILKADNQNVITLKTGINQSMIDGVDFDDVELMNLIVDVQ